MITAHDIATREAALVAAYRLLHPSSRAVRMFRFRRNGNSTKGMECILCGEPGPTWCGKWFKTRRAIRWEADHRLKHTAHFSDTALVRLWKACEA